MFKKIKTIFQYLSRVAQDDLIKRDRESKSEQFLHSLADGFAEVEKEGHRVCVVRMSPVEFSTIRKFGRNMFDPMTSAELLRTGLMGHLWGAEIQVNRNFQGIQFFHDETLMIQNRFRQEEIVEDSLEQPRTTEEKNATEENEEKKIELTEEMKKNKINFLGKL